ncbi:MAG: glycosyltransferase family 4 protein [Candidatus Nanoarchaeia archaeon]|nr:glycosyltransferase family 4 protein [Candidatus Nanoarchaeia archaeon]
MITLKMKILLLNWRDKKNPDAGGAELHISHLMDRLVKEGNNITWFCSAFKNGSKKDFYDGINFIRKGSRVTVIIHAFFHYLFNNYDLVIETYNGVPWFTPLYVKKKKIGIFFHRIDRVYLKELGNFIGRFFMFFESRLMRFIYRKMNFITISESSKEDMIKIGLRKVEVINPGVDLKLFRKRVKTKFPSVGFVGRLKEYKSIDHLIKAMPKVIEKVKNVKLFIIGRGDKEKELKELVAKLNLNDYVRFLGYVDEKDLPKIYSSCWVIVNTSMKEGWGLTAIEASASGTSVINADSFALKESIKDNETGFLYKYGDLDELSDKILKILTNSELRKKFEDNGVRFAKQFDWENIKERFYLTINKFVNN